MITKISNKLVKNCTCGQSPVYHEVSYYSTGYILGIHCLDDKKLSLGKSAPDHSNSHANYSNPHDKQSRKSLILDLISDWNK